MDIKGYELLNELCNNNSNFKEIIDSGIKCGLIRFFCEEEWNKINSQNFICPDPNIKEFADLFELGFNIGNCVYTSRQLSYSYDDVDLVTGILPIIKGTKNAEKLGGHGWLENDKFIIDTSLMLVIDKSLKEKIGYIEEIRITKEELKNDIRYQARKTFVNDSNLKRKK